MNPRTLLGPLLGIAAVLALWSLAALTAGRAAVLVPAPWAVAAAFARDGWAFYAPNLRLTLGEAARGFLWGNGIATLLAALVLLLPRLRRLVLQLATVSYCVPVIAVGPLLSIIFSGQTPMVALAALSVFFTTLTGALLGLDCAEPASLDLIATCGGGRWQQFRRVQLFAALPAWFAALAIAAPASLLGAVLGEWLGAADQGLGVAMVVAMQQADSARTWAIALACGGLAGLCYGLIALLGRRLAPWRADA